MTEMTRDLKSAFNRSATDAGFVKHSGCWYRRGSDVLSVLELQKSQYGQTFYVNVGWWLLGLGEHQAPKMRECHVRLRAGSLLPSVASDLENLLRLEGRSTGDFPREQIRAVLADEFLPVVVALDSLQKLQDLGRSGGLRAAAIVAAARTLIFPGERVPT